MDLETLAEEYFKAVFFKNQVYDRFVLWLAKHGIDVTHSTFENFIRFKKAKLKLMLGEALFKVLEVF
jgi:hypothetical protein